MFKKIWSYLTFQKQPEYNNDNISVDDTDIIDRDNAKKQGSNLNLRLMHGINRISIFMFLIGIIIVIIKILK